MGKSTKITAKRFYLLHVLHEAGGPLDSLQIGSLALQKLGKDKNSMGRARSSWSKRDWAGDGLRDLRKLGWVESKKSPLTHTIFYNLTEVGQNVLQEFCAKGGPATLDDEAQHIGPTY